MFLKELWELEYSKKNIIILIIFIILPVILIYYFKSTNSSRSILPLDKLYLFIPLILSTGLSSQLSIDSILLEKKTKTIETLFSSNLSKIGIIVGKILLPSLVSFISAILSFLILVIIIPPNINILNHNISIIIFPLVFAYLSSCVTILTSILIQDEKFIQLVAIIPIALMLFFIIKLNYFENGIKVLALFILLCVLLTILTNILIKRVKLITKI
jgi:ABC-type Na+ efflux pump permease subunit